MARKLFTYSSGRAKLAPSSSLLPANQGVRISSVPLRDWPADQFLCRDFNSAARARVPAQWKKKTALYVQHRAVQYCTTIINPVFSFPTTALASISGEREFHIS